MATFKYFMFLAEIKIHFSVQNTDAFNFAVHITLTFPHCFKGNRSTVTTKREKGFREAERLKSKELHACVSLIFTLLFCLVSSDKFKLKLPVIPSWVSAHGQAE